MQFNQLGLSETVLAALAAKGYSEATPIQAQSIPSLLQGRDHATPADVQALFGAVAAHRLVSEVEAGGDGAALALSILQDVAVD